MPKKEKNRLVGLADELASNPLMQEWANLKPKEEPPPLSRYFDWLLAYEEEFEKAGLKPRLVARALDGNVSAQSEISAHLLNKIAERKELQKSGQTHAVSRKLAVSDTVINTVAFVCLESAVERGDGEISSKLVELIGVQLGVTPATILDDVARKSLARHARFVAAGLVLNGITPSYRKIAAIMEVEPSTVMRWFEGRSLLDEAKNLSEILRETSAFFERFERKRQG